MRGPRTMTDGTKCIIDGIEYDDIPEYNGEPAFLGDGGPNPDFDWDGWRRSLGEDQKR